MQALYICLFNPFPSFSSPSLLFHFLALVSFLARSKPKISFLGLSSLRTKGKRKRLLHRPLFSFLLRLSYPFSRFPLTLSRPEYRAFLKDERRGDNLEPQCKGAVFLLASLFPSPLSSRNQMILSLAQRNPPAMDAILGQNWKSLMTISDECFFVQM